MSSALRYRAQAPLVDSLLGEIGLGGGGLENLTQVLKGEVDAPVKLERECVKLNSEPAKLNGGSKGGAEHEPKNLVPSVE